MEFVNGLLIGILVGQAMLYFYLLTLLKKSARTQLQKKRK